MKCELWIPTGRCGCGWCLRKWRHASEEREGRRTEDWGNGHLCRERKWLHCFNLDKPNSADIPIHLIHITLSLYMNLHISTDVGISMNRKRERPDVNDIAGREENIWWRGQAPYSSSCCRTRVHACMHASMPREKLQAKEMKTKHKRWPPSSSSACFKSFYFLPLTHLPVFISNSASCQGHDTVPLKVKTPARWRKKERKRWK